MSATTTTSEGFMLSGEKSALRPMLRELFASRDLLRALAKKNFLANYRRASLGMIWAIGLPMIEAAVLALVFSNIIRIRPGGGRNFAVFIFAGILPWSFFLNGLTSSVGSIIGGSSLSTRIYFPRALFPLVTVRANLYGFLPGLGVLFVMSLIFGVTPGVHTLMLLVGAVHLVLLTSAFSLVAAAVQVYFRDLKWIVSASTRPWFYATGVFFPLSLAPKTLQMILRANPTVGVVQMFRVGTVGGDHGWEIAAWWSVAWTAVMLVIAAFLYRRYDRVFPDRM